MHNFRKRFFILLASASLACGGLTFAAQPAELQPALTKLASARQGKMVKLPAGTFAVNEITVPSGVILSGAGTRISDLSVSGAMSAGQKAVLSTYEHD